VDHQTLEDNTVTIRERDSMEQERISIDKVRQVALERCSWAKVLA
ncbi:MAG: glycyl-tRNA synthetase, partial [Chitinophagales bacterium]